MPHKEKEMKVYVVERWYKYEGSTILGVFSTKEKAQKACDNDIHKDGIKKGDSYGTAEF